MNGEWDEIKRAIEADEYRKKKVGELKRKRQRKLKLIKRVSVAVVLMAVMLTIVISTINRAGEVKSAESSFDSQETLAVAVDAQNNTQSETRLVLNYPVKSTAYTEIADANVKSPYVALIDVENSQVIAGKNCDTKIYPASMTKVMTLIVAAEHLKDLDKQFTMTADIITPLIKQQASRAGFDPDEVVTVNDLFYGMVLPSGADAAVALATMTAGSENAFADLMNQKCQEIGLKNTHFTNVSGLYDDNQYTTPVEMAMIMEYAMTNPLCAKVLSTYQYTTAKTTQHPDGITLTSTMFSRMYGNEVAGVSIMAGKTGYTDEAGNCLVSYAEKNGRHYVALTAGASYKWYSIFDDFEIYKTCLPS